jgi:hypothetical protein
MAELLSSGHLVDAILLLVTCEVIVLSLLWRSTGKGIAPSDLIPNILAGAFLLLALRLALSDAGWISCCACLAAAGVAHLIDLRRRWH